MDIEKLGWYRADCRECGRLARFMAAVRQRHPDYHCGPVAPFGDPAARLLIVGLAPGKHGANASGRPFTGDHAGILLYRTLHRFGYASAPESTSRDDGLSLNGARITNAVKCLPPDNTPDLGEVKRCVPYLAAELAALGQGSLVLALGSIAHNAVLRALGHRLSAHPFSHGGVSDLGDGLRMLSSYHCSRYNTQTGRLTEAMFEDIFATAGTLLRSPAA
jgi:uracil-DNA glycosylase family 4